jgi:hypothetical protein
MAAALKAAAPGQLTFSGTEGYFGPGDAHVGFNPGAGASRSHELVINLLHRKIPHGMAGRTFSSTVTQTV